MSAWNIFRFLADASHIASKVILIISIHRNRSAEGVSLITQVLYAAVFCTRYTDIAQERSKYNLFFKIFYILSSFYTIGIMRWLYPRTREKELAWKMGAGVLGASLLISPFAMLIFDKGNYSLFYWLWDFSQILESVCVLPQLLLLRQTTVPTVIDSFYLLALGSYRALYLLNWIWRKLHGDHPNTISVIFGIIQTALYVDFAWVYYTRQRVKLRNGGVVDADDLRRGWLLNRIFGRHVDSEEPEDEESAPALGGGRNGSAGARATRSKWGKRGISVSADDGVLDHNQAFSEEDDEEHGITDGLVDPDAKMKDPDELARVLDDEDEDGTLPSTHGNGNGEPSGVRNGDEWND